MVPGRDGSCRPNGHCESAQSCCVHDLCDSKMRAISCSAKHYSRMRSKKRDVERKMVTLAAMKDSKAGQRREAHRSRFWCFDHLLAKALSPRHHFAGLQPIARAEDCTNNTHICTIRYLRMNTADIGRQWPGTCWSCMPWDTRSFAQPRALLLQGLLQCGGLIPALTAKGGG